jgi:hydrogenase nickel incorporation protein HypB
MCDTCGCSQEEELGHVHNHDHDHDHVHTHNHDHDHNHKHSHHDDHHHHGPEKILVGRDILDTNNRLAERNRGFFGARNIFVINMMSSPGSGKTTLLERTLTALKGKMKFYVIEGDQQTRNDADRISATGVSVVQINTGKGCHLDASMVNRAIVELNPDADSILFIENVGNLICPSMFDLGEEARVVLISVTEGDDKPLKYPDIFRSADLCIINKTDLAPYVNFNIARAIENGLLINSRLKFIEVSAIKGDGMNEWFDWLLANTR